MKYTQTTCTCPAYKFPHRLDSGECKVLYNSNSEQSYREFKAEQLQEFDRTEARGINTATWRLSSDNKAY